MKYFIINGSNRKKYNTFKLLNSASKGISDELEKHGITDAQIELINLYDLDYKGCKSCFHCKKVDGKFYGSCPIKDDLLTLLPEIWDSDGIIFGSPIYFGNVTGQMRSFLERLIFPKFVYGGDTLAHKIPTAFIYTMNVDKQFSDVNYSDSVYNTIERFIEYAFGKPYSLKSYNTYQFKDYSLYINSFDVADKIKQREEEFPKDLDNAYEIGIKIVQDSLQKEK